MSDPRPPPNRPNKTGAGIGKTRTWDSVGLTAVKRLASFLRRPWPDPSASTKFADLDSSPGPWFLDCRWRSAASKRDMVSMILGMVIMRSSLVEASLTVTLIVFLICGLVLAPAGTARQIRWGRASAKTNSTYLSTVKLYLCKSPQVFLFDIHGHVLVVLGIDHELLPYFQPGRRIKTLILQEDMNPT